MRNLIKFFMAVAIGAAAGYFFPLPGVHAQSSQFVPGNQQAVTGSAAALPSFLARTVCLKVVPAGTQVVYVGGSTVSTSTGYPLSAGDSICFNQTNLNSLYVIATTTGSTVAWFGQN